MDKFKKITWGLIIRGLRQIILAIMILFGILIFPALGFEILRKIDINLVYQLTMIGPSSLAAWLFVLIDFFWFPVALTIWVVRDARKFKTKGINTSPFLWFMGMCSPFIIVILFYLTKIPSPLWSASIVFIIVFLIYFVLRDVSWRRKIEKNILNGAPQEIKLAQSNEVKKRFFSAMYLKEFFLSIIAIAFVVYVAVVLTDLPHKMTQRQTEEQVIKIHATKLTIDDVMGKNLPLDPGADADKTIQGIDANQNGIRDDVELAIFKEYPNSAKTRAALLQYALTLQMQMTLPIVNMQTVTATVEDNESRANICLWTLSSRSDLTKFLADMDKYKNFIKGQQINTEQRKKYMNDFFQGNLGSYSASNEGCDLDPVILPN